jgi:hypothetical protein
MECTFSEAIIKCEKNGGRFRKHLSDHWIILTDTPAKIVVFEKDGDRLSICPEYFRSKWIYEPPKESAFQKWESGFRRVSNQDLVVELYRKEGWNACSDAAHETVNKCLAGEMLNPQGSGETCFILETRVLNEIKELKEP